MLTSALTLFLLASPKAAETWRWTTPSPELKREAQLEGRGWKATTLFLDKGVIDVLLAPSRRSTLSTDELMAWVKTCARSTSGYFGRFPVSRLLLRIGREPGHGVHHGVTYGGRFIHIDVGEATTTRELGDDWVLTHELFHLAFPEVPERYLYLQEGLSTYLEPISRTRAGVLSAEETWRGFVEGLPNGLPGPGDEGLDSTATWGNTYWGGARFWLLADLEIRRRSKGTRSLDDALKAILSAGGDGSVEWEIEQVFKVGDEATGTSVLTELHAKMGSQPMQSDLDALWKHLGVRPGTTVTFDDEAPEAALRKAIAN